MSRATAHKPLLPGRAARNLSRTQLDACQSRAAVKAVNSAPIWNHLPMPFEMQAIPGVSGVVRSEFSFWTGLAFIVDGQHIKPRGFRRHVTLPGTYGAVEARLKGGLPGAQTLLVDGQEYATGPAVHKGLRIVALLPILALLLAKPWWSFPAVIVAVVINTGIIRSDRSTMSKVTLIVACSIAACGLNLALATNVPPAHINL